MKKFKKIMAVVAAMAMTAAMSFTTMAGTISITPPNGTQEKTETQAGTTNTYKIYKVFDGVGDGDGHISYKVMDSKKDKDLPSGFTADAAGNVSYTGEGITNEDGSKDLSKLNSKDIAAIKAYIEGDDPVDTATSVGTEVAVSKDLPDGYYFVATSTGTAVTIDTANHDATVIDKNTVPTVDKVISKASSVDKDGKKALAQVGTDVEYTATVTAGKGSKNLVFHDKMDAGLTLKDGSVKVTGVPEGKSYNVNTDPTDGDTLDITFDDGIAQGTVITITYTATINENAVTVSQDNHAKVTYGDNNASSEEHNTKVYNAEISVVKYDGQGTAETTDDVALAGAGFVLKNAAGKYYQLGVNDETKEPVVNWVDAIADATVRKSGADGKLDAAFTGLPDGTYTLEESVVPTGYNKAADVTVEIKGHDYSKENLSQSKDVLNNKGSQLPTTGGMGTTILYVAGAILVIAGAAVLVIKKRHEA